ncbi:hypothetical protein FRB99_002626 [Tulasnella sp. 403]|nr:hypothetical protein FRB99_002626 [Tulasnella sp. 403]
MRSPQSQSVKSRTRGTLQTQYRLPQSIPSGRLATDGEHGQRHPRSAVDTSKPTEDSDTDILSLSDPSGGYTLNAPQPRSTTPSHAATLMAPSTGDLEAFALLCKAWFFAQDAAAYKSMTSTLATLPPAHKATYTKVQARIRQAFHNWSSIRRLQEFRALLSSISPGASLSPLARPDPHSPQSRLERQERFTAFVRAHCLPGAPGVHPFFHGLYAVLVLQSLNINAGGAGAARVQWEIDDGVFLESGGKEFMKDALDTLKGILGFEERMETKDVDMEDSSALDETSDAEDFLLDDPHLSSMEPQGTVPNIQLSNNRPPPPAPPRARRANSSSSPVSSAPLLAHPPPSPVPPTSYKHTQGSRSTSSFLQPSRGRAPSDPFLDPSGPGSSPGRHGAIASRTGASGFVSANTGNDMVALSNSPPASPGMFAAQQISRQPPTPQQHTRHQSQPLSTFSSGKTWQGYPTSPRHTDMRPPPSPSFTIFQHPEFDIDLDRILATSDGPYGPSYKPLSQAELDQLQTAQLRIWTAPSYLTNPEIRTLLTAFPPFITKTPVPRFTSLRPTPASASGRASLSVKRRLGDLEEGLAVGETVQEVTGMDTIVPKLGPEVRAGTGRIWAGEEVRDEGWRGGLWARFLLWLRGMFR